MLQQLALAVSLPLACGISVRASSATIRWHSPRRLAPVCCAAGGTDDDDADAPADPRIGDLLLEVLNRQAAELPLEELLERDASSIDAMLESANAELSATWDDLSADLMRVERNVSATLESRLNATQRETLRRLVGATEAIQRGTIDPGRRAVQKDLRRLRDEQAERDRIRRLSERGLRGGLGRDPWWQRRLATGGAYVRALELTAGGLGLLLLVAAVDIVGGALVGPPYFPVGGGEGRAALVFAWRAAFALGFMGYMGALVALTQPGFGIVDEPGASREEGGDGPVSE